MAEKSECFFLRECKLLSSFEGSQIEYVSWKEAIEGRSENPKGISKESDAAAVYLSVIGDAMDSGWVLEEQNGKETLRPPSLGDMVERKKHIQRILDLRVSEQRRKESVSRFLDKARKSANVKNAITRPKDFPRDTDGIMSLFQDIRLEIVETKEGSELYRFFRHSWRIPYESTPGRTLSFLIKNGKDQVVGIFTLASPTLWMSGRDESLGFESIERLEGEEKADWERRWRMSGMVDDESKPHHHSGKYRVNEFIDGVRNSLVRRLEDLPISSMGGVDSDALKDLGVDVGSTKPTLEPEEGWANDLPAKRVRLLESCKPHLEKLSELGDGDLPWTVGGLWEKIHGEEKIPGMLEAFRQGLKERRSLVFSTSVADINICGAVPPYNALRVGKLASMLTMSKEVSEAWKSRYEGQQSVIASQIALRPIVRISSLAALSTTGLYGRGNVQYDRVSVGSGASRRRMKMVGETGEKTEDGTARRGPSNLTISRRSWSMVDSYCQEHGYIEGATGRFGEGTSARLRRLQKVRSSLSKTIPELFDPALWDRIVLNPFSRSIHTCLLSRGSTRFLIGADEDLVHATELPSVEQVVNEWRSRWLSPLLGREGFSDRIDETLRVFGEDEYFGGV